MPFPLNYINNKEAAIKKEYEDGKAAELYVIQWLRDEGHDVREATEDEDFYQDIDCWVDGVPTSIKCNQPKFYNAPFCFETFKHSKCDNKWYDSWFYTGSAQQWIFWKRSDWNGHGKLWAIIKHDVLVYVAETGFDVTCRLTPVVQARESAHNQDDSELGLIKQHNIVEHGLGSVIHTRVGSPVGKVKI